MLDRLKTASGLAAASFALFSVSFAQGTPEYFEIDVILEDLEEARNAEDFEKRLQRSARRYCKGHDSRGFRRASRACEDAVTAAVMERLEEMADERGVVLALDAGR